MRNKKFLASVLAATMMMAALPVSTLAASHEVVAVVNSEMAKTTASTLALNTNGVFNVSYGSVQDGTVLMNYDLTYEWNDEWFTQNNQVFNAELAKTSSIFAGLAYYSSQIDLEVNEEGASTYSYSFIEDGQTLEMMDVMALHGFEDIKEYNLRTNYNDNNVVQFNVGRKTISNGAGKQGKEIIAVAIRGTRGEIEWLSNFEMGESSEFGGEWTEANNHKGFDITANRVVKVLETYMAEHKMSKKNTALWVTGHSRGAAVANLVGKKLEDRALNTYTYTFATPNTTIDTTSTYNSIFNVVNKDDLVASMPMPAWGFTKYGQTAVIKMDSNLKNKWAEMTGKEYKSASALTLNATVKLMGGLGEDLDSLYTFEGEEEDYTLTKSFSTSIGRSLAISTIPSKLKDFYELETYTEINEDGKKAYCYKMKQTPMYLIQAVGLNMAGSLSEVRFLALEVAPKYQAAKATLLVAGVAGISHAHYLETYIDMAYETELKNYFK